MSNCTRVNIEFSEELIKSEDLIEKKQAEKNYYPNGTFAYS